MRQYLKKYLGTFITQIPGGDPSALGGFTPAPPPPPAPFVPVAAPPQAQPQASQRMVPLDSVIDMADAIARRNISQQRLEAARQPTTEPAPAAPQPVQSAPGNTNNGNDDFLREVRLLKESNNRLAREIAEQRLENYRITAIQNARAAGYNLIDSLVTGRTPAEIDASVQFAVAEYAVLEQQILAKNPPQQPQVQQPPYPQGTVTSTQVTANPGPQQQDLSLPQFVSAPGIPDQGPEILSPEQLSYLTSSESIRNGTYAANRHQISAALRRGAGSTPPQGWSMTPGYSLAPPMPAPVSAPPPGRQPGTMGNPYAGVTIPTVVGRPQPMSQPMGMAPGVPYRGIPTAVAPQPAQFQVEVGPGQYAPNGAQLTQAQAAAARGEAMNHTQGDMNAARQAAAGRYAGNRIAQ